MPKFSNKRLVAFTPQQMFDVVADVEAYPQFLPLCDSLSVRERRNEGEQTVLIANMGVGYQSISESFTSRVTLAPSVPRVDVEYLDGPFHHMQNRWLFADASNGCEIDFFIDYEFRSRMLGVLMGAMFDKAFRKFAGAFEDRARLVYGGTGCEAVRNR